MKSIDLKRFNKSIRVQYNFRLNRSKVTRHLPNFTNLIILALASLFSYFNIFKMYFWHDDYTHLYFAQNNIAPSFPYHINTYLVGLLYSIFELNPIGYFAFGLTIFISSTFVLYFILSEISKSKNWALLCSLIFAAGLIGQQSIWMLSGDGAGVLSGMFLCLITLYWFIKYLKTPYSRLFFVVCLCLFLTLEFATHRYLGLALFLVAGELFLVKTKRIKTKLLHIVIFLSILIVQYLAPPTRLLMRYIYNSPNNNATEFIFTSTVEQNVFYLANTLRNMGNVFIPNQTQQWLHTQLNTNYFVTMLFFGILGYIFYWAITLSVKKKLIHKASFIILEIILAVLSYSLTGTSSDILLPIGSFIGGTILIVWIMLIVTDRKKYHWRLFSFMLFVLLFAVLALRSYDLELASGNRYLMTVAFAPSLFLINLIGKQKKHQKVNILVGLVAVLLIGNRLYLSRVSGSKFVNEYSTVSRNYFSSLLKDLPSVNGPTIFYTEATSKQLWYSLGDAARVGQLPSESAYAFHYKTKMDNILLPQNLCEVAKFAKDKSLPNENIKLYTFDGYNLTSISEDYFQVLNITPNTEQIISTLDMNIPSFKPLVVKAAIKPKVLQPNLTTTVLAKWDYDIQAPPTILSEMSLPVRCEENQVVEFIIPPVGGRLTNIAFTSSECEVEIIKLSYSYLLDNEKECN